MSDDKPWSSTEGAWGPNEELLLRQPTVEEVLEADWRALRGEEPIEGPLPHMSDDKLREFVVGVLDGSIYTSDQVREPNLLPLVFLPLALGALKGWSREDAKDIGIFYANMSTALPRSVNGYPIFPEVFLMHREDWARASKAIHRELSRRKTIEV